MQTDGRSDGMRSLVVGCPVAHRSWILEHWFNHVEDSCANADIKPIYAFVVDQGDPCIEIIEDRAETVAVDLVASYKGTDQRSWNAARYAQMVTLRNRLLSLVRDLAPDWFLSIDSDILAHPNLVERLLADAEQDGYDAIGGKCYLTQVGTKCPSWGRISKTGSLQRYDTNAYFPAEVIMAIKLMTPAAYGVNYETHQQGEDIGWSGACARAGLRLAWDGRIASKHVLAPHQLSLLDPRVGF